MQRHPVSSSNIASIGYEDGVLEIEFNSGGIYQYSGVPMQEYQNLMNAGSIGSYFAQNIKHNYACTQVA